MTLKKCISILLNKSSSLNIPIKIERLWRQVVTWLSHNPLFFDKIRRWPDRLILTEVIVICILLCRMKLCVWEWPVLSKKSTFFLICEVLSVESSSGLLPICWPEVSAALLSREILPIFLHCDKYNAFVHQDCTKILSKDLEALKKEK